MLAKQYQQQGFFVLFLVLVQLSPIHFTELTTPNFADAAMMLQQMGVYSSTGKVLTKELVRSAYYNLRSVYGSQVYFKRGSANYRVMREKGMTDEEIQQYYKELNNNNNNAEEV